jgi:predicted amidohydrolase
VGRPVRICSISFANGPALEEVAAIVDREAAKGVDLVALPETFMGQDGHAPETLDGPCVRTLAELAARHRTYIVCPIDRTDGTRPLNTAVLIDRHGQVACTYDKVYPYWSEFDVRPPVTPGADAPVYEADFGRIGMAICFDANFPEVWKSLADQGAELVVWPSAYSAGTTLQAHALNNQLYIVTSTQTSDCVVFDISGREVYYQKTEGINVSHMVLDLDRMIFHENFNIEKRDRLLAQHGDEVEQEFFMQREQWFVLRAKRPGASVHALAAAYGMEDLRAYKERSRREIDLLRGAPFRAERATL